MHDTRVVLKDGRVLCGPIWLFRPAEGYLTLVGNDPETPIYFRDCVSVTTGNQRVSISKIETEDELERARKDGWDGT